MKRALFVILGLLVATSAAAEDRDRVTTIGEEAHVKKETPHPVPQVEAGAEAWRDVFTWEKASYIAVHFEKFNLEPGEKVVVRTPDGKYAYAFEGQGKAGSGGTFWATHVPGDTCEVVYYGNGRTRGFGYVVDKFAHGFPPSPPSEDTETICGADDGEWAKCYQTLDPIIYDKSRAIARLMINGVSACTGWLVGCEGHLMTNGHCITNPADAINTDYEFMAEGATCTTECRSFGACPSPNPEDTITGGTLIKTGTQVVLDYSLVLLSQNVSGRYGFFRLRESGPVLEERMYLNGHPQAWGKQFHVLSDDATDESGFCEILSMDEPAAPGCSAAGPNQAGYMCDTQSGNSGSPVVAYSDHRVIVLHHCSGCPNTGLPIQQVIADLGADLPDCSLGQPDGKVNLDQSAYSCTGVVAIQVVDDSIAGAGSQNVSISSNTETTPETVTLTETPPNSGIFTGTISLTTAPPASGNGLLSVGPGDTITVLYIDADDGQGGMNVPRTDTASVDCLGPAISNVAVTNITGDSATITWTTNEPATSTVRYGLAPPPDQEASNGVLVTSHSLQINGLSPCTPYFFSVSSADAAENGARDDNGGSFYTFTTRSSHPLEQVSTDTPMAIPDFNPAGSNPGATSTIQVIDNVTVTDVNVKVNITHTFDGDIEIYLITPTGVRILLADQRGDDGDNYRDTIFDDEAAASIISGTAPFTGSFRPERPLSQADGINAAGDWKLNVVDLGPTDFGTIDNWTLMLTYAGGCGASMAHEGNAPGDTCSGTGGGGGNGIVEPGEDIVLPLTLRNDGTSALTGITATLSTSTTGVTVTRSTATYPNTAVGETAVSNPPHYAFSVGSSVACGSSIQFTISGTANEGSFSNTFSIMVGAPGIETATYDSPNVPRPIPDTLTTTSTVAVADTRVVRDVDVSVRITHTYVSDLDIFLIGPNGTRVELSTANGGSNDNYTDTIFDDEADQSITTGTPPYTGRFRPETPLSALDGIPANGTWTLEITDNFLQDPGVLEAWSVTLTTGPDLICDDCLVAAPPDAVQNQRFPAGPKTEMTWDPVSGASFYNVYRGVPPDLPKLVNSSQDSCRRMTVPSTTTGTTLAETPSSVPFFWYLVRAGNAGGEGPAGNATAGPRTHDTSGACP